MVADFIRKLRENTFAKTAILLGFGAIEGYAFATSGIAYPAAFRSQMNFTSEILLQLFISAVGSSMVVQGLFSYFDPEGFDNTRVWKYSAPAYARAVGGCFILGCGMAVAGSGPTMLPAQVGVGMTSALYIFGGSLIGGAAFALLEEQGLFSKSSDCTPEQKTTLEHHVGGSYAPIAVTAGSMMLLANAVAVPRLFDVRYDQASLSSALITTPFVAGLVVGLNQIPVRLMAECGHGGSTSMMQLLATFTRGTVASRFQIQDFFQSHQLLYVWGGTLLGALLAGSALHLPAPPGFSPLESLLGGALMMFGARIATGCTCGHGVSGFSELSVRSMCGAAAIFAGGIATVNLAKLPTSP